MLVSTIIGLIVLFIFRYDVHIKEEWNGKYIVWKSVKRDLISGEFYEIYYSRKLW